MQSRANQIEYAYDGLADAFPEVDCGHRVVGEFIIVQIRTPKRTTAGGIELPDEVRETEYDNTQVGKVIGIGDCCFKNRNTGELWPEGAWYKAGDFVRVPKYGGDRWMVKYEHTDLAQRVGNLIIPSKTVTDHACFAIFKDRDVRAVVTGNPLELRAFI